MAHAENANPQFFKIVSTSPGGIWHTVGTQLAEKLQKKFPDIAFSHTPGGSQKNQMLVSEGKAQMASASRRSRSMHGTARVRSTRSTRTSG